MTPTAPLVGQVALVTGAGRRVGRAIAFGLAADGAQVAVHFNESEDGARETVQLIEQQGGVARAYGADLSSSDAPAALIAAVTGDLGRLDVLVNSAASMKRTPLDSVTPEEWDAIFAINLRAPFFLAIAAARAMGDAGGVIVSLSDHMGFEPWAAFVPHSVSKAAVSAMTHALAAALAPRVRVNAIAPGAVLAPPNWPAAEQEKFAAETPLRRVGTPEDVAQAVRYLVSAPYVTGETLFVDGGRHSAR